MGDLFVPEWETQTCVQRNKKTLILIGAHILTRGAFWLSASFLGTAETAHGLHRSIRAGALAIIFGVMFVILQLTLLGTVILKWMQFLRCLSSASKSQLVFLLVASGYVAYVFGLNSILWSRIFE